MFTGKLVSINIAEVEGGEIKSVDHIRAVPGKGLEGDRYYGIKKTGPGQQVTLIEAEALEALDRERGINLSKSASRRNLVTRDVPLNHLVGVNFRVGIIELRGIKLCEPCDYLEKNTQKGVRSGLVHRGGLRAEIFPSNARSG